MIGIYKITNLANGKIYIGQSIDVAKRLNRHKKMKECLDSHLQKAFAKYGLEKPRIQM